MILTFTKIPDRNGHLKVSLDSGATWKTYSVTQIAEGIEVPDDQDYTKIRVASDTNIITNIDVLRHTEEKTYKGTSGIKLPVNIVFSMYYYKETEETQLPVSTSPQVTITREYYYPFYKLRFGDCKDEAYTELKVLYETSATRLYALDDYQPNVSFDKTESVRTNFLQNLTNAGFRLLTGNDIDCKTPSKKVSNLTSSSSVPTANLEAALNSLQTAILQPVDSNGSPIVYNQQTTTFTSGSSTSTGGGLSNLSPTRLKTQVTALEKVLQGHAAYVSDTATSKVGLAVTLDVYWDLPNQYVLYHGDESTLSTKIAYQLDLCTGVTNIKDVNGYVNDDISNVRQNEAGQSSEEIIVAKIAEN